MQIELSGVLIPNHPPHNPCGNEGCTNQAHTAVWVGGRNQHNVCMWHLRENLESKIWELK